MYSNCAESNSDLGELKFLMLLTRHGARSPSLEPPDNATITNSEWKIRLGDLTRIGERQHYLLGTKFAKDYIGPEKFLSDKFDPREVTILSTNFNRTLMSAYSELSGFYPGFQVKNLTEDQVSKAVTPFTFNGEAEAINLLDKKPTQYGFTQVPIHDGSIDQMMRGMDTDICPYQEILRDKTTKEGTWKEANDKYQEILFPAMVKKFNADNDTLDLDSAYPYVDNYYSAWFDQMEITNPLAKEENDQIEQILRDGLYVGFYELDIAVRLATSRYFNWLYTTIEAKLNTIINDTDTDDYYKRLKFMYLSAHDSTISAVMSGFQQKQDKQVEFASYVITEVYQKPGTSGKNYSDFTVRMLYNGEPFSPNVTETCPDFSCDFPALKEFLKTREYDGDIDKA